MNEVQFGQMMGIIILGLIWSILSYASYKIYMQNSERPLVVFFAVILAIVTPMILYHAKIV